MSKEDEITITQTFKSNDMVADSDLLLRHKIRDVLYRTNDVSRHRKIKILEDEKERLLTEELDELANQGAQMAEL